MIHHLTALYRQLHWLKALKQIAFIFAVLVYKCLYRCASLYLIDELCQLANVEARQLLRFSSSSSLIVSRTQLTKVDD